MIEDIKVEHVKERKTFQVTKLIYMLRVYIFPFFYFQGHDAGISTTNLKNSAAWASPAGLYIYIYILCVLCLHLPQKVSLPEVVFVPDFEGQITFRRVFEADRDNEPFFRV